MDIKEEQFRLYVIETEDGTKLPVAIPVSKTDQWDNYFEFKESADEPLHEAINRHGGFLVPNMNVDSNL